ncbi:MAG: phospholipase D-like domain-containing protein [Crocinitomicaceae bacterium]
MAKYLDTSQISSELMQLLKEAKERIILVTYSLKVNTQIQERLKTKSKIGTLAEISLIYGNTKPKKSELEWMAEIDDLKVWQKKNLHAKCYINENKAIISSMNLYDYSQTTNVEMGFLITKEDEPEAYQKMMDDIDDLKINGDRLKPWILEDEKAEKEKTESKSKTEKSDISKSEFSYNQQIKKQLLEFFRSDMSTEFRQKAQSILSDSAILDIITKRNLTKAHLKQILKSDKKVKQLGEEILDIALSVDSDNNIIGRIEDTRYQNDDFSYDQIKMLRLDTMKSKWYDTKQELPRKGQIVAVRLNNNWFNDYLLLEETDNIEQTNNSKKTDFSASTYYTTKELSKLSGLSSRDINSALVSLKLMFKKEQDWFATKEGAALGGIQKEGQYGKFIIWPEQILDELELA